DKPTPRPVPLPPQVAAPAKPDAALAPAPPDGFPARGAPTLAGALAGKKFALAKASLRYSSGQATLSLYGWKDGEPCAPQLAAGADDLYLELYMPEDRFVAGALLVRGIQDVGGIYKHGTERTDPQIAAMIDELAADHATGRLMITAADATRALGTFTATVCGTPQHPPAKDPELLGLHWGQTDAAPPKRPVSATLLGKTSTPIAVELVDWQDGAVGQHELHFLLAPAKQPCSTDLLTPGFKIGFASKLATMHATSDVEGKTDIWPTAVWSEPGGVVGMADGGFASVAIDKVTADEVRGRVFAWTRDASKSLIAGAFVAKNCHIKP
ncbi:MAG: hypothetical protein ABI678_28700, partial [Kofleriaceae bacterium]